MVYFYSVKSQLCARRCCKHLTYISRAFKHVDERLRHYIMINEIPPS